MSINQKLLKSNNIRVSSLDAIPETLNEFEGLKDNNCEGYLYLQAPGLWMLPTQIWRKRYCMIRDDKLYFLKDHEEKLIHGVTTHIKIEAETGIYPKEYQKGKHKYCLRIVQLKQTFILCSKDENERNKWLSSLLTIITRKYIVNFKIGQYKSIRIKSTAKRHALLSRSKSDAVTKAKSENYERWRVQSDAAVIYSSLKDRRTRSNSLPHSERNSFEKTENNTNSEIVKQPITTNNNTSNQQQPMQKSKIAAKNSRSSFTDMRDYQSKYDILSRNRRDSLSFAFFRTESMFDLNENQDKRTSFITAL